MAQNILSESEEIVMQAIWDEWDGRNPVTTRKFMPHFADKGWTITTTFTFIRRLEDKGFLRAERSPISRRENVYFPLIVESKWRHEQNKYFIRTMRGGITNFVATYFANNPRNFSEIEELQILIYDLRKEIKLFSTYQ